jgi:hypothetical protein
MPSEPSAGSTSGAEIPLIGDPHPELLEAARQSVEARQRRYEEVAQSACGFDHRTRE